MTTKTVLLLFLGVLLAQPGRCFHLLLLLLPCTPRQRGAFGAIGRSRSFDLAVQRLPLLPEKGLLHAIEHYINIYLSARPSNLFITSTYQVPGGSFFLPLLRTYK